MSKKFSKGKCAVFYFSLGILSTVDIGTSNLDCQSVHQPFRPTISGVCSENQRKSSDLNTFNIALKSIAEKLIAKVLTDLLQWKKDSFPYHVR